MKPYFYYKGLCTLAEDLMGSERIYLGIRPYGFHAGNAATMVAYPLLLCRELERTGKLPCFTFFVFINDWEQEALDGPDTKLYPFNVLPKFTTWQYIKDPIDNKRCIVDYWESVIMNNVRLIQHYFPKVKIVSYRNSKMKNFPEMKRCILRTIDSPHIVLEILKKYTRKKVLPSPAIFASAVCPQCHAARGKTFPGRKIVHKCVLCGHITEGRYKEFDYWLYHKPLALPRISHFNIDLCITGSDHFSEGDYLVRQKLFEAYSIKTSLPKTLYTPSIFGSDGKVMGKSKGNARSIDLDRLINLILKHKNCRKITIPEQI